MREELIQLLAGRRGHFEYESGYHGETWFELDSLFETPGRLSPYVAELARRLTKHRIEAVCGPETGGATLARLIADELELPWFAAERFATPAATGLFPVRYAIPPAGRERLRGQRLVLVDDAISAGSAVRSTYAALMACGAQPVVIGALFVFGNEAQQFADVNGLPLETIAPMPLRIWPHLECPLCRAGDPLERIAAARRG